jgi:hypothetical protein
MVMSSLSEVSVNENAASVAVNAIVITSKNSNLVIWVCPRAVAAPAGVGVDILCIRSIPGGTSLRGILHDTYNIVPLKY